MKIDVSLKDALDKLMAHLSHPVKCIKSIEMIFKLLVSSLLVLNPLHILDVINNTYDLFIFFSVW